MEGDPPMAIGKTDSTAHELLTTLADSPDSYPQKLDLLSSRILQIGYQSNARMRLNWITGATSV